MDQRLQGVVRAWLGSGAAAAGGPDMSTEMGKLTHEAALDALADHGLLPLLAWACGDALPPLARSRAQAARRSLAAQELVWDEALADMLEQFAAHDLPVLIFKGQHLAHSHYPEPALRTRCDMDLLIRPGDRSAVEALFSAAAYQRMPGTRGEHALTQMLFHRFGPGQVTCVFDVHWQVSNRPGLAQQFPYQSLSENAVALTGLHEHARGLSDVDALLLACAHRAGHHADHDRWIWLYDVHLLCEALDTAGWESLVKVARQRELGGLCRETLRAAHSLFDTSLNENALRLLADDTGGLDYLTATGRAAQWRMDAASLPLTARARWLREHLFPDADYMRERYGKGGVWLPFLYIHRAAAGVRKLFR